MKNGFLKLIPKSFYCYACDEWHEWPEFQCTRYERMRPRNSFGRELTDYAVTTVGLKEPLEFYDSSKISFHVPCYPIIKNEEIKIARIICSKDRFRPYKMKIYFLNDYMYYDFEWKVCSRVVLSKKGKMLISSIHESNEEPIVSFNIEFSDEEKGIYRQMCNCKAFFCEYIRAMPKEILPETRKDFGRDGQVKFALRFQRSDYLKAVQEE